MSSLIDILTQRQPHFQTHQALLVLDLQNDFLCPDGKLPISPTSGFLARIKRLAEIFRENAGDVIWVRSTYVADRPVNDGTDDAEAIITTVEGDEDSPDETSDETAKITSAKPSGKALEMLKRISRKGSQGNVEAKSAGDDEPEHFLSSTTTRQPCCVPRSRGIEFAEEIKSSIDPACDILVNKTFYSAFNATSLLLTLRTKLITELYICGCMTNLSVYATALDAARYGLTINLVEDCMGYRKASRHREAIRQMSDIMGAYTVSSVEILNELARQQDVEDADSTSPNRKSPSPGGEELTSLVRHLRLSTASLYSDNDSLKNEKRGSGHIEELRQEDVSSSLLGTSAGTGIPDYPLRSQHSGKLQKKSPTGQHTEARDSSCEKILRNKRSKIRMRQREPLPPRAPSPNAGDPPSSPPDQRDKVLLNSSFASEAGSKVGNRPSRKYSLISTLSRRSVEERRPASSEEEQSQNVQGGAGAATEKKPRKSGFLSSISRKFVDERSSMALPSPTGVSSRHGEVLATRTISREDMDRSSPDVISHTRDSSRGSDSQHVCQTVAAHGLRWPKLDTSPNGSLLHPSQEKTRSPKSGVQATTRTLSSVDNSSRHASSGSITRLKATNFKTASTSSLSLERPDSGIGEGDSFVSTNLLPSLLSTSIFQELLEQVRWQTMYHQTGAVPRLVCAQGELNADGDQPIYRHPADSALPLLNFSTSVRTVKQYVEKIVRHPLNHVLIQLYRSGQDYISEHSDKTLDIVRGSSIVNASFGAQRTMRLRTKKSANDPQSISFGEATRQTQRIPLPHNSAFVLGQETNMRWLHGITADKRPSKERSPAEKAYHGMRISLTFRYIGTYLSNDSKLIWGQGAMAKSRDMAHRVVNNDLRQTEAMVYAFGKENHATEFDWEETYGRGFDVLHFRNVPSENPNACVVFLGSDEIENKQVKLYLDEAGLDYAFTGAPTKDGDDLIGVSRKVCFRDSNVMHTEVQGALAVLLYLDRCYPFSHRVTAANPDKSAETRQDIARQFELIMHLTEARSVRKDEKWLFGHLESLLQSGEYVAGKEFGYVDCAYYPVLERCWEKWDEENDGEVPKVKAYMKRMKMRIESKRI